jgi:hypothetical protein
MDAAGMAISTIGVIGADTAQPEQLGAASDPGMWGAEGSPSPPYASMNKPIQLNLI